MFSGLLNLALAAEIQRADMDLQGVADPYFVNAAELETREVSFSVESQGAVEADLAEFQEKVTEILLDERGWKRAGVNFSYVSEAGKMKMVLASPEVLEAIEGCSDLLSCAVYPYVYINDERWRGGSESYNALEVSVEHYREMVVNHEVGHYLGHEHISACETAGGKAPIMLQQSTGLRGCAPSFWPLSNELWVTRW